MPVIAAVSVIDVIWYNLLHLFLLLEYLCFILEMELMDGIILAHHVYAEFNSL